MGNDSNNKNNKLSSNNNTKSYRNKKKLYDKVIKRAQEIETQEIMKIKGMDKGSS